MKNNFAPLLFLSFIFLFLSSCKKDEATSCTTCISEITSPFELCRESDGNAWINGENTHSPYDEYLAKLEAEGVRCEK